MSYATGTTVPVERTRLQLEALLKERGASQLFMATDHEAGSSILGWTMGGRMVRLAVPLPDPKEPRFKFKRWRNSFTGREWPRERQQQLWDQACRARWRAVLLIVLAKFEAIEAGISTLEREFLSDMVMANGETVGAWVQPQLEEMYASGRMPRLLPAAAGGAR